MIAEGLVARRLRQCAVGVGGGGPDFFQLLAAHGKPKQPKRSMLQEAGGKGSSPPQKPLNPKP